MRQVNSIQVFDIDEPVIFPEDWPQLVAGKSRFGFKLVHREGQDFWTEAVETDLHDTLTQYGYTDSEVAAAVNERKSAELTLSGCNWNGTACVNQCDRGTHCKGYLNVEARFHTCWCEVKL